MQPRNASNHRRNGKHVYDQFVGNLSHVPVARWNVSAWKRFFDVALAATLFVFFTPAMLALTLLVRMFSRGPGIFRQSRVGRNGRTYRMYKIRTMRVNAEARSGPVWAQQNDPRCTRFGRWLRLLHLDELPQLANVLRGHMSLVGPRPERPEFVEQLADVVPGYLGRLRVRPGITGLAQILLPPDHELADVPRKLAVDQYYIQHAGSLLDLKLLVFTALRLLRFPAAWCNRLVRLPELSSILEHVPAQSAVYVPVLPGQIPEISAASHEAPEERERFDSPILREPAALYVDVAGEMAADPSAPAIPSDEHA